MWRRWRSVLWLAGACLPQRAPFLRNSREAGMNASNGKRVLLISNSTLYGSGYLDHAEAEIRDFLRKVAQVLFIPFALHYRDNYAAMARARFNNMGYRLESIHNATDPQKEVDDAEVIFIGGGNTFRLLKALY